MPSRFPPRQIARGGASDGDAMAWSDSLNMWVPDTRIVVRSIVQGANVTVNATDPENPVVAAVGSGGGGGGTAGEVLMTDGIASPPEPIWNEDGTDWLYSEEVA